MRGIVYGVGVGPGDPEQMTLAACRLIRENEIIAIPGTDPQQSAAYRIAVQAVPELAEKTLVMIDMPMVRSREEIENAHRSGADAIAAYLDRGKNVVYLTLGDPSFYCSFSYLQSILEEQGYSVCLVSGIPSFCAAAAKLDLPLALGEEPVHIIPASGKMFDRTAGGMDLPGTVIFMKTARHMREVKAFLEKSGREAYAVENCGMENEHVYRRAEDIPDTAGYFTLVVTKEK